MSLKKELSRLRLRLSLWLSKLATSKVARELGVSKASKGLPSQSLASCWDGKNAAVRHMNTLSPKFSDDQAKDRFAWALNRGCNTVHLFVCNQADGEAAGFSIYGGKPNPGTPDKSASDNMVRRIKMARDKGLAVVLWLMADDSSAWNKILLSNPVQYAADLRASGVLDQADAVCLGLEMDEYMSTAQASALASAIRGVYNGKLATHHTAGKATFASLGDLLFWQTKTGLSAAQVKAEVAKAAKHGKPVVAFELERSPSRSLCEAALSSGAVGVGNW